MEKESYRLPEKTELGSMIMSYFNTKSMTDEIPLDWWRQAHSTTVRLLTEIGVPKEIREATQNRLSQAFALWAIPRTGENIMKEIIEVSSRVAEIVG